MVLHCATPTTLPPALPCLQPRHRHGALPHPGAPLRLQPCLTGASFASVFRVRRRVRYEEDDEDEEWGHNEDLASLERYSEDARDQALLVKARVDDEVQIVLVFRVS